MRLHVRLTPRGGADRIEHWARDDVGRLYLKVRVRAAAVDGEANAALIALIAKSLDLPKSAVRLAGGQSARLKSLDIDVDEPAIRSAFGGPPA
jgi:uncharacterized protein YggU (UPF0235/DUF167 family)